MDLLTNGLNDFGLDLFRTIYNRETNGNVIVSSLSVIIGMLMTLGGARNETSSELIQSLRLGKYLKDTPNLENMVLLHESVYKLIQSIVNLQDMGENNVIKLGNKILVNSIQPSEQFRHLLIDTYAASVETVQAASCQQTVDETNKWIREFTNGRIRSIIDHDTLARTSIALINAIYFKQEWKVHFDTASQDEFRTSPNTRINVNMMQLRNTHIGYSYSEVLKAHMLSLPYKNDKFAFNVIFPSDENDFLSPHDQSSLASRITYEVLTNESRNLQMEKINLKMPKFTTQKKLKLNEILISLGIKSAFNSSKADFSGITEDEKLFIQEVLQYVFIDVNEKGTEAAAATVIRVVKRSLDLTKSIVLDRPFIYYISESSTNLILFFGTFNGGEGELGESAKSHDEF